MLTINSDLCKDFDFKYPLYFRNSSEHNYKENYILISGGVFEPQTSIVTYIEHYRNIYASPENFIKRRIDYGKMKVFNEKYRKEIERLKTFKDFPKHLDHLKIPMAKSGFYYIENDKEPDKVKCIYCQGILSEWSKNDIPNKDHKKSYPTCPFLLNLNVGNESIKENGKKYLSIDPDLKNKNGEIPYNVVTCSDDILLSFPTYLNNDIEWRESTFKNFKHLKSLVFEGLYVEERDKTSFIKCCKCSREIQILKEIEKLPANSFHQQNCNYLSVNKSYGCTLQIYKNEKSILQENKAKSRCCKVEYSITDDEIEARMDSRKANEMEKFFGNREIVKHLIATRLRRTGKDYESIFELLQDARDYKENKETEEESSILEIVFQENFCVVCLDKPIAVIFLPCGHFKTCKSCSKSLSSCPVCRLLIEKRVSGIQFCEVDLFI